MSNFDEHDWACMHDVVLDATGHSNSQQELENLFAKLPLRLREEARRWGMSDTVWRDELSRYLERANPSAGPDGITGELTHPRLLIGPAGQGRSFIRTAGLVTENGVIIGNYCQYENEQATITIRGRTFSGRRLTIDNDDLTLDGKNTDELLAQAPSY